MNYSNFTISDAFERAYTKLNQYETASLPVDNLLRKISNTLQKITASVQQAFTH